MREKWIACCWDALKGKEDDFLQIEAESDGYLDEPETLICKLKPAQTLKIEFYPGDTVYYINDKRIACAGSHYILKTIPFKELINFRQDKQIFLLLLPLAVINSLDIDDATRILLSIKEIFDIQQRQHPVIRNGRFQPAF